ncbi:hypothetical protein AMTR_s00088p00164330 [Amborella trichopoda]|uniref:PARP catalytic domain-containing protein n=2 Tax=Amborella trichopoda TaxID=13333 RepID=W1NY51_AMBTC|nr:hypothetical protein AMTR_s00088p00164330 [Amborella trichopoda]
MIIKAASEDPKRQFPEISTVLKVVHSPKAIERFENYREAVKFRAQKQQRRHPRWLADGNELLRFHTTTIACQPSSRCLSTNPPLVLAEFRKLCKFSCCGVCRIVEGGFQMGEGSHGKIKMSSLISDRFGDVGPKGGEKRAVVVCRVIAGRVGRLREGEKWTHYGFDSMVGCSNCDELYVNNPQAILPCFVVIY